MSHFGLKLRGSKNEFWLARHREEPLLLESKTGGQGQSPNSDFGHRFLDCGRLLNSYYEHGHVGLSIWSPPLVATLLSKTYCFPMKNLVAARQF